MSRPRKWRRCLRGPRRRTESDGVITRAQAIQGRNVTIIRLRLHNGSRGGAADLRRLRPRGRTQGYRPELRGRGEGSPQAELLFEQDEAVWMNADVAVITLTEEVKGIAPVKLAGAEVKERDRIVLVGYGENDRTSPTHASLARAWFPHPTAGGRQDPIRRRGAAPGRRRGRFTARARRQRRGLFQLGTPPSWWGSTPPGGRAQGAKSSLFTSVYPFRDWLQPQLQAARAGRDIPSLPVDVVSRAGARGEPRRSDALVRASPARNACVD